MMMMMMIVCMYVLSFMDAICRCSHDSPAERKRAAVCSVGLGWSQKDIQSIHFNHKSAVVCMRAESTWAVLHVQRTRISITIASFHWLWNRKVNVISHDFGFRNNNHKKIEKKRKRGRRRRKRGYWKRILHSSGVFVVHRIAMPCVRIRIGQTR